MSIVNNIMSLQLFAKSWEELGIYNPCFSVDGARRGQVWAESCIIKGGEKSVRAFVFLGPEGGVGTPRRAPTEALSLTDQVFVWEMVYVH